MKGKLLIFYMLCRFFAAGQQNEVSPEFTWGNGRFFNLNIGETVTFLNFEIKLLKIDGRTNLLKVNNDTVQLYASGRTLPLETSGLKLFAADNKTLKIISDNKQIHNNLKKDLLICVWNNKLPSLPESDFVFPVGFSTGFNWNGDGTGYFFAAPCNHDWMLKNNFLMNDAYDFQISYDNNLSCHPVIAVENSTVVQTSVAGNKNVKEIYLLLKSNSNGNIYYKYRFEGVKSVKLKTGEKLETGQEIVPFYTPGQKVLFSFSVIYSETEPDIKPFSSAIVNVFPQLYELYYRQTNPVIKNFTKGRILFSDGGNAKGISKNMDKYEDWTGKGWLLGAWNIADKVEWTNNINGGNARLKKTLFENTKAMAVNPVNYFDYEISCPNGIYRIRANMGDVAENTWQRVEFEGIKTSAIHLGPGESKWTDEIVAKVSDLKLTTRIYLDTKNKVPAGISEIVFQQIR